MKPPNEGVGIMVYDSHDATLGNNLLYSNVTKRGSPGVVYPVVGLID